MSDSETTYYTHFNNACTDGWSTDEGQVAVAAISEIVEKFSMTFVGNHGWAFVSEVSASEASSEFRSAVAGVEGGVPIGFAWLTPMDLFVDHRWLEGDLGERFYAAREAYEKHNSLSTELLDS